MGIHISAKHRVVAVPTTPELQNLFPDAKQLLADGQQHIVLPHGPAETILLRNLGLDVPAPITAQYDWAKGNPFDVQKKTCALLTVNTRAYVLNGMGTGKTRAALWAWDYLRGNNLCGKMLVVAPLSTLNFTWAREVLATLPHRKCMVLHGTKAKRLARLDDPEAEIFIVNHDGLKVIHKEIEQRSDIDVMCIDELAVYRSPKSDRSKLLRKMAPKLKWVWGMTGSPIPNSPVDAWAQAMIVTPKTVPARYTRFRDELMYQAPHSQFVYLPKPDAVERAFAVMQPAVRYTLDDVAELPECIERTVDVDLGPKQDKIYKTMSQYCYAAVQAGEITAANAGALMNKLLQVSTGWVYTKDKTIAPLDNDKRIDALVDGINATDRKVLVFVPYKHALAGISAALTHEGIEHAIVSGDTAANERARLFNLFQNTQKYRVLLAHPECLAHGITLTAADTVIWFAPVTSLEIYDQANHRIRRVGQTHKQLILHLQSTPVERRIYSLLRNKQKVQNKFLELFEEASK